MSDPLAGMVVMGVALNGVGDVAIAILLVVGGVFGLVGSWGLIRLPDIMTRLHAPTKATTLGVGGVLVASMVHFGLRGESFGHEFLITLLLFLTAPITALFIAKSVIHRRLGARDLPATGTDETWATLSQTHAPTQLRGTAGAGSTPIPGAGEAQP